MAISNYLCIVNSINEHIEHLILRHDCVIMPGIGALIAHYQHARIDEELGCIFPPARHISFNPDIKHNDGLLATSIARRDRITYDQAVAIMDEDMNLIRSQIEVHGEYAIGRIGTLSKNPEGSTIFTPFAGTLLSPRYCGLSAIAAIPISIKETADNALTAQRPSRSKRFIKTATSTVALLCLGLLMSTPIIENGTDFAGIAPAKIRTVESEPLFIYDINPEIQLNIAIPGSDITAEETLPAQKETTTTHVLTINNVRRVSSDPYFLIVASLPTREKAAEFIAANSDGNSMEILETAGRYRVYIASGNSYSAAQAPLADAQIASKYPDAWVCRRD